MVRPDRRDQDTADLEPLLQLLRDLLHRGGHDDAVELPGVGGDVEAVPKQHLDIDRIAAIKKATGVPLTLHGGSGTDDNDFRRAIAAGISIIHINTELRVAWRRSLENSLAAKPEEVVPYKILPPVVAAVKEVVL